MSGNDKLHALLAVEGDVKGKAEKILKETISVFKKKDHFHAKTRHYEPLEEGGMEYPDEIKEMVTTVSKKLAYTSKALAKAIDLVYQKETTNSEAKADLIVEGKVLAEGVPATALLSLESRLKAVRAIYDNIPTLSSGEFWEPDGQVPDVHKTRVKVKFKSDKVFTPVIMAPATKEHPAQIKELFKDKPIGKWLETDRSGEWTSTKKSQHLERVDILIAAAKKARQRANDTKVVKVKLGKKIFDYIDKGIDVLT